MPEPNSSLLASRETIFTRLMSLFLFPPLRLLFWLLDFSLLTLTFNLSLSPYHLLLVLMLDALPLLRPTLPLLLGCPLQPRIMSVRRWPIRAARVSIAWPGAIFILRRRC